MQAFLFEGFICLMIYFSKVILMISIASFSLYAFAEDDNRASDMHTLKIMAGLPKPPFIIEENGEGIELDIFRDTFATANKKVNFIHVPFGRTITSSQRLNSDGIVTVLPTYKHPSLFISEPYITYQNVAISLLDKNFEIDNIKSLAGKNIIAFQNAKKYLGEDFNKVISYSMNYREVAEQLKQIDMLFLRRTEVIILDINIFKYFMKTHSSGRYSQPFNVHYIFNERQYSAAFKLEENRNLFDKGIKIIREQGTYQFILDKYLTQQ
jgi:polar amino acid transport system substrate-binding protein